MKSFYHTPQTVGTLPVVVQALCRCGLVGGVEGHSSSAGGAVATHGHATRGGVAEGVDEALDEARPRAGASRSRGGGATGGALPPTEQRATRARWAVSLQQDLRGVPM